MTDIRESILVQLLAIADAVPGIKKAYRNATDRSEQHAPCFIIFDGNEESDDGDPRGRPANAPRRITMTPEIYLLVAASGENIGAAVNQYRAAFIKAVLSDSTIVGLTANNMGARYESCSTGLSKGTKLIGEVAFTFSFTYLLRPDDL